MVGVEIIKEWLHAAGWRCADERGNTLRIAGPGLEPLPFFVRCTENWLLLAIVPAIAAGAPRPPDLSRRLLAVNRDMRMAKYSYDEDGDVALTAELPTESLHFSELRDAITRMARYAHHYREYLTTIA